MYFEDARLYGKKKGDVTLAFSPDDELYLKIKDLGSSQIKEIIGINTYQELLEEAKKDHRPSGNFVKHKLRIVLEHEEENTSS